MIRLYRIPFSANVERVALALAHKRLPVESVLVDPADRSVVRAVSGQDLVPVIDDEGRVVSDSMEIIRYLDDRYPQSPLYPHDRARRAELMVFIEWFNRVWKVPPNEIDREMGLPEPDEARIAQLGAQMTAYLDLFENMLSGRYYLMAEFSAADCAAYPFLKYGTLRDNRDTERFHQILAQYQPISDRHPRLKAWISRVDRHPRV